MKNFTCLPVCQNYSSRLVAIEAQDGWAPVAWPFDVAPMVPLTVAAAKSSCMFVIGLCRVLSSLKLKINFLAIADN
jgi:hypothetical protein